MAACVSCMHWQYLSNILANRCVLLLLLLLQGEGAQRSLRALIAGGTAGSNGVANGRANGNCNGWIGSATAEQLTALMAAVNVLAVEAECQLEGDMMVTDIDE
jgi:hypothetical protein